MTLGYRFSLIRQKEGSFSGKIGAFLDSGVLVDKRKDSEQILQENWFFFPLGLFCYFGNLV